MTKFVIISSVCTCSASFESSFPTDFLLLQFFELKMFLEFHANRVGLRNKWGRRGVCRGNPCWWWEYRLHLGCSPRCSVLPPSVRVPYPPQDIPICSNSNCFRVFLLFAYFFWVERSNATLLLHPKKPIWWPLTFMSSHPLHSFTVVIWSQIFGFSCSFIIFLHTF